MITQAGRTLVRELIKGDSSTGLTHLAVGTGTTADADADTTLETETTRIPVSRMAANGDRKAIFEGTISSLDSVGSSLTEVGLLTAATAGSLFNHNVHTAEAKDNTKEFRYIIQIEVKA